MANYKNTKQASNIGAAVTKEEVEMLVKDLHNVRKFMKRLFHQGIINRNAENEFDIAATCTTVDKAIFAILRYNTMLVGRQDLPDAKEV